MRTVDSGGAYLRVGDLISFCDPDAVIVVASSGDGDRFSPAFEVITGLHYVSQSDVEGSVIEHGDGKPCVVIYPSF